VKRPLLIVAVLGGCVIIPGLRAQEADSTIARVDPATQSVEPRLQPGYPFSTHRFTQENLRAFPFRGIQNYLSILPGVVFQNGNLHFRGGRAGEVGYYVDGFSVTNPFFNSNGVELIPEAIEQLDVVTGAYGAEFGRANAGLVLARMKTGTDSLEFSLNVLTDNVVRTGQEFLKTTSFGYSNLVGTLGGPLLPGVKFLVAAQYDYFDNRQQMFLEPFRYDSLFTDQLGSHPQGTRLPGPVEFKRNYLPNNWSSATTIQGNSTVDLDEMQIQILGSYSKEEFPDGGNWPRALSNYFRQKRNMLNERRSWFGGITFSHKLDNNFSYSVGFSLYDRFSRRFDPDFGDDWMLYSDSLVNAQKGYMGFISRYSGPPSYSTIFNFRFEDPNAPNNPYYKDRQTSWALSGNIMARLSTIWTLHAGGELEQWSMRKFEVASSSWLPQTLYGYNGLQPRAFTSEHEKRVVAITTGISDLYGYDYIGEPVEDGYDAPRKPRFASMFFNNRIQNDGFSIDVGGRYEVFDLRIPTPNLVDGKRYQYYIDNSVPFYNILDQEKWSDRQPTSVFLPRLSILYRPTPGFVTFATFGKYAQSTSLQSLFVANLRLNGRLNQYIRQPYWFGGSIPGFLVEPERSTHYEFGIQHFLSSGITLGATTYYKTLTHQVQLGRVYDDNNKAAFVALTNNGEGISKGLEISLELHDTRVQLLFTYAFADARGRSSDPFWNWRQVTDEILPPTPEYLIPFDFSQTHRGSAMMRVGFTEDDGDILGGLELRALLTFNSGRNYTRFEELLYLGASGVWNVGVRQLLDPRSANPVEAFNSSSTPSFFNIDFQASKQVDFGYFRAEFCINILNVLNARNVINVYPVTGTPTDDGWFGTRYAQNYIDYAPLYEGFYRAINLQNRWAYMNATGNDLYGPPRQIRFRIRVEM